MDKVHVEFYGMHQTLDSFSVVGYDLAEPVLRVLRKKLFEPTKILWC